MTKKSTETEKKESEINPQKNDNTTEKKELICGIVMPISSIDGCSAEHWSEVLSIIKDSICERGFIPKLVSDADDSGIIQNRIVQNLYKSDIVVCDVSAKNPNVMFELGLRLAFDKPTIIVKDDKTDYSFDTSIIEHLPYPRDLRFTKINIFKKALSDKIEATYKASQKNGYTTFLKHFGEFKVAKLEQTEVGFNDFVLKTLKNIDTKISNLENQNTENKLDDSRGKSLFIPFPSHITKDEPVITSKALGTIIYEFSKKNKCSAKDIIESTGMLNDITKKYIDRYWKDRFYKNEQYFELQKAIKDVCEEISSKEKDSTFNSIYNLAE